MNWVSFSLVTQIPTRSTQPEPFTGPAPACECSRLRPRCGSCNSCIWHHRRIFQVDYTRKITTRMEHVRKYWFKFCPTSHNTKRSINSAPCSPWGSSLVVEPTTWTSTSPISLSTGWVVVMKNMRSCFISFVNNTITLFWAILTKITKKILLQKSK